MSAATGDLAPTPAASVSFGSARRPEDATLVRLHSFDGPLALLLSLIEQRQLDVLSVRLGELAGAYLDAVAQLERGRLPMLSAFVGICSQLILIKSRALLPRNPPPPVADAEASFDPEEDLRQRLILYRQYRNAGQRLGARLLEQRALFHREPAAAAAAGLAGARPADEPPLDPSTLAAALATSARLTPPAPPPPAVIARTVTLQDRASIIRDCLRETPEIVLQELLRDVTDRVVVAVTFLALLEMAKGREVVIEQAEPWGPIVVRGGSAGASHAA